LTVEQRIDVRLKERRRIPHRVEHFISQWPAFGDAFLRNLFELVEQESKRGQSHHRRRAFERVNQPMRFASSGAIEAIGTRSLDRRLNRRQARPEFFSECSNRRGAER
jgi:hypothetical protein